jgi:thioredoxin-like negative regulator of GroEL
VTDLLLQADRLLTVDRIDQAEALYRQAAELDPRSAAAVIGLAKCEVERGHDRDAYDLTVRALAIDPDNDTAQRMGARLAEVLAGRGEPVPPPPSAAAAAAAPGAKPSLLGRILGR